MNSRRGGIESHFSNFFRVYQSCNIKQFGNVINLLYNIVLVFVFKKDWWYCNQLTQKYIERFIKEKVFDRMFWKQLNFNKSSEEC